MPAFARGLENRPFMVVDDCWQVCRTDDYIGGPWDRGNGDFPDMKGLADEIKALNVRPGIWYRPLWNRDAAIPDKCRLMRKKDIIDPSVPESLEIIAEDVKRFSAWGYQLIKYDFPTYDIFGRWGFKMKRDITAHGWHFRDRTKTSAEIIKGLYKTIYENSNGAYLIGCNCIGHLAAGYVHINRIGDDISGKKFSRTRKMGVNSLAFRLCQHKAFYEADARLHRNNKAYSVGAKPPLAEAALGKRNAVFCFCFARRLYGRGYRRPEESIQNCLGSGNGHRAC